LGIGLERTDDVDPIQGVQVIEMHEMVMLVLGAVQQVAQNDGIFRNLNFGGTFHCPHRGQTVDVRSDPAGALDEVIRVTRITSLQNDFNASEHLPGAPGIDNLAPRHLDFDAQVAFYSSNRIYNNSLRHMISSFRQKEWLF
jgi:hypothetical protein